MTLSRPPSGFGQEATARRRRWLEEHAGRPFEDPPLDQPEELRGIIENHIGWMPMPMAVAGPLRIDGTYARGEFGVPLCTVEGTLALSMSRGFLLTSLAGGITTRHLKQEMSRSPVFSFEDIVQLPKFLSFIERSFESLKQVAEATTRHGELLRVDCYPIQNSVILDFVYDTKEACGQNMVSIATNEACHWITAQWDGPVRWLIESNFNGDKNPAAKTVLCGRGHHVVASARIGPKLLRRVLRVTARDVVGAWKLCVRGSQLAGVVGMNKHVDNALAALYLATGQDVACVAENAVGVVDYDILEGDGVYATLTMPSISVGTVGGGTRLAAQKRNLELLGCTGPSSSRKLAEIVCAAALALELSLGGAIVSNEFVDSHAKYGR